MAKRIHPFEILNPQEGATNEAGEAEDAIRALAGHACAQCGKTLSRRQGYGCCGTAHCPICGRAVRYHSNCEHLVATRTNRLGLLCGRGAEFAFPAPPRWAKWNQAIWSDAQLREAYGDHYEAAAAVFGADWNQWSKKHFRQWLMELLHPDICTTIEAGTRRDRYWFSRDSKPDAQKVFKLLDALRRGNARLHTMEPVGTTEVASGDAGGDAASPQPI